MADARPCEAGEETARAAAFVRLADEHLDRAYRLARAILRDPAEAQDATHDAFVQAWRKWDDAARPGALRAVVRPDPRQHLPQPPAVDAPAGDRHLGRGRARDRRPRRPHRGPRRPRRRHRRAVARPPGRRRAALLPRPDHRRHRDPTRHPGGDGPVAPPLRAQAAARGDRRRRHQGDRPMTDRELEARLRAWYRAEVGESETAPLALRRDVAAIPRTRHRRAVGSAGAAASPCSRPPRCCSSVEALAAGSGLLRLPSVVPPVPEPSVVAVVTASPDATSPSPSDSAARSASPIPVAGPGGVWLPTGSMVTPRSGHAAVRLLDGRVLVVGGGNNDENDTSAELYDPDQRHVVRRREHDQAALGLSAHVAARWQCARGG